MKGLRDKADIRNHPTEVVELARYVINTAAFLQFRILGFVRTLHCHIVWFRPRVHKVIAPTFLTKWSGWFEDFRKIKVFMTSSAVSLSLSANIFRVKIGFVYFIHDTSQFQLQWKLSVSRKSHRLSFRLARSMNLQHNDTRFKFLKNQWFPHLLQKWKGSSLWNGSVAISQFCCGSE